MTPSTVRPAHTPIPDSPGFVGRMSGLVRRVVDIAARVPDSAIALLGRFSIAAVFWKSGQTKIEGFAADFVAGEFSLGWPRLSDSAVALFLGEYKLPLIPPEWAAQMATVAEHLFPVLLVLGLATRLSALALLGMTLVIQVFVYPDAWPTHLSWAALMLYLAGRGAGSLSLDRWLGLR